MVKSLFRPLALGAASAMGLVTPVLAAPHAFTFADYQKLAKVSDPQPSPDGQMLYFAVSRARLDTNRWQSAIYVQPLGPGGVAQGPARKLTAPERGPKQEGSDGQPRLSPDGRTLAFVSSRDGQPPQVYVMSPQGGEARRITSLPSGVEGMAFTPDSRALIVQARVFVECPTLPAAGSEDCQKQRHEAAEKNPVQARLIDRLYYRHFDTWYDGRRSHLLRVMLPAEGAATATPVDLTPGDYDTPPLAREGAKPYAISPDGKELAFVQTRDPQPALTTNNDVFVLPLGADYTPAGPPRNLTEKNLATDTSPRYSPDGRFLAYLAQRRPGFEADRWEVWLYDRKSGQRKSLTESVDKTVHDLAFTPDGRRIVFTSSDKARGVLYSLDLAPELLGGPSQPRPPVELSIGDTHDLALTRVGDGSAIYFSRSTLSRPAEIFRMELDGTGSVRQAALMVTHINDAVLADVKIGVTSQLWSKSQDELPLQGHLITPPDFVPTRRYPAAVVIHGGPQGAWEDAWHWRWNAQLLAGAGYVVLMPNPRGSDGFGQKFVDQVSSDWGGRPYDDLMRLVDQLVAQPFVDGKRVAALGASYGGYMVNWIAGHTDRFAALVSHAGVYDLRSMYGETEEVWFPRWEFAGDLWNSDQYDRFSPSRFAANFKTPMLVISNDKDYRVPVGQGMQLFTALQVRKVPSRLLMFPDENHWVLRPGNARLWYAVVLDWLHRYVGGAPADAEALKTAGTHAK